MSSEYMTLPEEPRSGGSTAGEEPRGGGRGAEKERPEGGSDAVVCPNCGEPNAPGAKYCGLCGEQLPITRCYCPDCGRSYGAEIAYCVECGTMTLPGDPPRKKERRARPGRRNERLSDRSWLVTLILSAVLGVFGVHRFYAGKIGTGILYLLTFGCFGIGWLVDIITIACGGFRDKYGNLIRS